STSVSIWLKRAELPTPPILDIAFTNPAYDFHIDPHHPDWDWAKTVAGGNRFLVSDKPAWEWNPILDPQNQFDERLVGLTGWVVATHLSDNDNPFLHPFGFDWNLDVVVDAGFHQLVAPQNLCRSTCDVKDAVCALGLSNPFVMHVETDQ